MDTHIINDEFVEDNTYRGEAPAWQDPTGNSSDAIETRSSIQYMADEKVAKMHIRYSYDIENQTQPINIHSKFFVVVGDVGFFTDDLIKKLPFSAVPVPSLPFKVKAGPSLDAQATNHLANEYNAYAKDYLNNDKKEIRVADRWFLNSIVECPKAPCLWDKAIMNPTSYIVLFNNNTEEIINNMRPGWIKKYNEIVKENKNVKKRIYTELELRYKKKRQLKLVNLAYEYLGNSRPIWFTLNCEGLSEEKILDMIYKFINGYPKEGVDNDKRKTPQEGT